MIPSFDEPSHNSPFTKQHGGAPRRGSMRISVLQVTDDQCRAEASKKKMGTNAIMDFHFESGRGPGIFDKLSVCPPAFNTGLCVPKT
ncbi:hypothetical protein SAMN05444169_4830 [Bradyrhizobium erythrophlei]|uniref:Uncharacterized protein n=1 Tax=Bradyrhizobium erythrophlei TaxID=1437360 RepID=A0A1M5NTF9_9BRAD|nr:hypothetical protein SAMN05444169_4830 [Bradyrhizobium erythrophlei]